MSSGLANIDLVEVLFSLFWVFFIGLVYYLQREMKREGYPLVSDRSEHVTVQGFPPIPSPKEFRLEGGRTVQAPRNEAPDEAFSAAPAASHPGAPLNPTGDPLMARIGPGSWAERPDIPEKTLNGEPRIVPMRSNPSLYVDSKDIDPRGMPVVAADGKQVGTVSDLWIDLAEPQIYFLEVQTDGEASGATAAAATVDDTPAGNPVAGELFGEASGEEETVAAVDVTGVGAGIMVPFGFADIDKRAGNIRVNALYGHQFANVPRLRSPDRITLLEEDKIMGYFGGGLLMADDKRAEPYF